MHKARFSGETFFSNIGYLKIFKSLCYTVGPSCLFDICQLLSQVQLFVTPWTITYQAPLFRGISRQDY